MISKILGAIKRIFGSEADSSEFEEAKTDPGVDSEPSAAAPAPAPTPAPAPSVSDEADEEADTTVDEPEEEARPVVEAPEAAPSEEEAIVVKGVTIAQPAAVLAFANDASEDALKEAGVKGAGLKGTFRRTSRGNRSGPRFHFWIRKEKH